jgi:uncharacterized protein YbaP (TraB family)
MDSDIEALRRALLEEAETNKNLVQELYDHVRRDPRTKSWPNFKAIDIDTVQDPEPAHD